MASFLATVLHLGTRPSDIERFLKGNFDSSKAIWAGPMSAGKAVFAYDPSAAERAWMAGFLGMKKE